MEGGGWDLALNDERGRKLQVQSVLLLEQVGFFLFVCGETAGNTPPARYGSGWF